MEICDLFKSDVFYYKLFSDNFFEIWAVAELHFSNRNNFHKTFYNLFKYSNWLSFIPDSRQLKQHLNGNKNYIQYSHDDLNKIKELEQWSHQIVKNFDDYKVEFIQMAQKIFKEDNIMSFSDFKKIFRSSNSIVEFYKKSVVDNVDDKLAGLYLELFFDVWGNEKIFNGIPIFIKNAEIEDFFLFVDIHFEHNDDFEDESKLGLEDFLFIFESDETIAKNENLWYWQDKFPNYVGENSVKLITNNLGVNLALDKNTELNKSLNVFVRKMIEMSCKKGSSKKFLSKISEKYEEQFNSSRQVIFVKNKHEEYCVDWYEATVLSFSDCYFRTFLEGSNNKGGFPKFVFEKLTLFPEL